MPCDLLETQEAACISGIGKISNPIELLQVIAQLSCERADAAETDTIVDSFVERSGISDQAQIDAITGLVQAARDNGWWEKCDLIYPFVGGTAGAHAQNLKSASFPITWNGTVTHDANGITGNGTDGYGDTGYIPVSSGMWALNSSHISIYRRTAGTDGRYYFAVTEVSKSAGMANRVASNGLGCSLNDGTPVTVLFAPAALGANVCSRVNSTQVSANSSSGLITVNQASSGLATASAFILARRTVGVGPQNFANANFSGATLGSGLTSSEMQIMATDWQTFQTALGRQV